MHAVAMFRSTVTVPTDRVCTKLYDPWYRFRPVCQ